jgi:hypothetical protein
MYSTLKSTLALAVATVVMSCTTIQAAPGQPAYDNQKADNRVEWHRKAAERRQLDPETRQEMMALRHQKATIEAKERLLKVKTALNLRDDQMAAWNEYETYMLGAQQERHIMMSQMQQRRMENRTPPNSLELAEMNVQRLERQLAEARDRLSVFTNLYAVLDEEQKEKVDKLSHHKIRKQAKELRKKMRKADKQ